MSLYRERPPPEPPPPPRVHLFAQRVHAPRAQIVVAVVCFVVMVALAR